MQPVQVSSPPPCSITTCQLTFCEMIFWKLWSWCNLEKLKLWRYRMGRTRTLTHSLSGRKRRLWGKKLRRWRRGGQEEDGGGWGELPGQSDHFSMCFKIGTKFHNFSKLSVWFYRALCVCLSLARARFDHSNFVADGSCGQGGQGTIGGSLFLFYLSTLNLCSVKNDQMVHSSKVFKCLCCSFIEVFCCVNTNSQLSGGMEQGVPGRPPQTHFGAAFEYFGTSSPVARTVLVPVLQCCYFEKMHLTNICMK